MPLNLYHLDTFLFEDVHKMYGRLVRTFWISLCVESGVRRTGRVVLRRRMRISTNDLNLITVLTLYPSVLIVSLVIYKQRKDRNSPKAGLLDDIDDETGNIMVYSNEGGGEEDQVISISYRVYIMDPYHRPYDI